MDIIQNSYSEWLRILERPFHDEVRHVSDSPRNIGKQLHLWISCFTVCQDRTVWFLKDLPSGRRDLAKDLALRMELVQLMTPQQVRCSRSTVWSTEAWGSKGNVTVSHRMSPSHPEAFQNVALKSLKIHEGDVRRCKKDLTEPVRCRKTKWWLRKVKSQRRWTDCVLRVQRYATICNDMQRSCSKYSKTPKAQRELWDDLRIFETISL